MSHTTGSLQCMALNPDLSPVSVSFDGDVWEIRVGGVDVTSSVERVIMDISRFQVVATVSLAADVNLDQVPAVIRTTSPDWLEGVTAKEIEQAATDGDYAQPLGEKILAHLKRRASGG